MSDNNPNVTLLASLAYPDDATNPADSKYRFLVDGKFFKYVTVAPGALGGDHIDRLFAPVLLGDLLPPFPPGDWNKAHVDKDPETGEAAFITTEKVVFPAVKNVWHPVKLNELDFAMKKVTQRVHIGTTPGFNDGQPVLLKFAVWPDEIEEMENETTIYEQIDGQGIGPRCLGHLTEGKEGRVIGIVTELVENARRAKPADLEDCRKALMRLHALGIQLGDTNPLNFLVREGHGVVLIDFEVAEKCSPEELEEEMDGLEESLADAFYDIAQEISE